MPSGAKNRCPRRSFRWRSSRDCPRVGSWLRANSLAIRPNVPESRLAACSSNSAEPSTAEAPHCLAAAPNANTFSSVRSPASSRRPTVGISSTWRAASSSRFAARPDSFAPSTSGSRAEPARSLSNPPTARNVSASARALTRPAPATTRLSPSSPNPCRVTARSAASTSSTKRHARGSSPAATSVSDPAMPLPFITSARLPPPLTEPPPRPRSDAPLPPAAGILPPAPARPPTSRTPVRSMATTLYTPYDNTTFKYTR